MCDRVPIVSRCVCVMVQVLLRERNSSATRTLTGVVRNPETPSVDKAKAKSSDRNA